jgi:class 3 adenylate cyclase
MRITFASNPLDHFYLVMPTKDLYNRLVGLAVLPGRDGITARHHAGTAGELAFGEYVMANDLLSSVVSIEQQAAAAGSLVAKTNADQLPPSNGSVLPASSALGKIVIHGKVIDYPLLLKEYARLYPEQARKMLTDSFLELFGQAQKSSGVEPTHFGHNDDEGRAATKSAADADRLCEEMLKLIAASNQGQPNFRAHKHMAMAIIGIAAADLKKEDRDVRVHHAFTRASHLADRTAAGQISIGDEIYQELPRYRQDLYSRSDSIPNPASGSLPLEWRLQVDQPLRPPVGRLCVMRVDMARFSKIVDNMTVYHGDRGRATTAVQNDIMTILSDGFKNAVKLPLDRFLCSTFEGDGGNFLFTSPADAHRVAVEILKRAEEHNHKPREKKMHDALRCFRIGVDFGEIKRDATGEYGGAPFIDATRLEAGGPTGEIRMSEPAYRQLPEEVREFYGDQELVAGKDHDAPIPARRFKVTDRALWIEEDKLHREYPPIKYPNRDFLHERKRAKQETCFIICPINSGAEKVGRVFETLIGPVCEQSGLSITRADRLPGNRKKVIGRSLKSADIVVAYLGNPSGGWNTNVILEVGFRLATGLPLVIISDTGPRGEIPDYQRLLPLQLVHDNILTIGENPADAAESLRQEIEASRSRKPASKWNCPHPEIEFLFRNINDVTITETNDAARNLFGTANVQNGPIANLRASLDERCEQAQIEARRAEFFGVISSLFQQTTRTADPTTKFSVPLSRIPIVFKDAPSDRRTGTVHGYLPILTRWTYASGVFRMRYMFVEVSGSMRLDRDRGFYVCDV